MQNDMRKGKKKRTPITDLDQESVVNGLSGVIEITLLVTTRTAEQKASKQKSKITEIKGAVDRK